MRPDHDAMLVVRADLCERVEAVRALASRRPGDAASRLAAIRTIAAAYGLEPVARLALAWEHALAATGGTAADLYLDRMRDAIGCGPADEATTQALLASISVRLSH